MATYMRSPNTNMLLSQYFMPNLRDLSPATFPFALGTVTALLFHEEPTQEDVCFSIPLDSRSGERVLNSLFELKFMDRLMRYVLDALHGRIQASDVYPTVTFHDPAFDALMHFFMRYVAAAEHGQGLLMNHLNDIVTSLLALYAGNPFLTHSCAQLLASPGDIASLSSRDSAFLYVFTYSRTHALVRYALEGTTTIPNNLVRTAERDDGYFDEFMSFSEAVFNFTNAMCHGVDKQRSNGIKTMASLWSNRPTIATIRLFIDFGIPQKVAHCVQAPALKLEALSFFLQLLEGTSARNFEPAFNLIRRFSISPIVFAFTSLSLRSPQLPSNLKAVCCEIARNVVASMAVPDLCGLVATDVVWAIAELARDPLCQQLLSGALCGGSVIFVQLVRNSAQLQHACEANAIETQVPFDVAVLKDNLDFRESFAALKKLLSNLAPSKTAIPDQGLVERSVGFFVKLVKMSVQESDSVAKFTETQLLRANRYEIKESQFMKAQTRAKELAMNTTHAMVASVAVALFDLFRILCHFRCLSTMLLETMFEICGAQVPPSSAGLHPFNSIHEAFRCMLVYGASHLPPDFILARLPRILPTVFAMDIEYTRKCAAKDFANFQFIMRYPAHRAFRAQIFKLFIERQDPYARELFEYVLTEMIHDTSIVKLDSFAQVDAMQFPLRIEALNVVYLTIQGRELRPEAAAMLVEAMAKTKFMENERRLTEVNDSYTLVKSSIELLERILGADKLFDDELRKAAESQRDWLKMRFYREWNQALMERTEFPAKCFAPDRAKSPGMRPATSIAGGRASIAPKKSEPKIVTVKTNTAVRATTAAGNRKR
jgi:hypothetical protein